VEAIDYFARSLQLFRTIDTYRALAQADIVPSRLKTYRSADILTALETFSGGRVVLKCEGQDEDVLREVLYAFYVSGSVQTGTFIPAKTIGDGETSNCASVVRYMPKRCHNGGCTDEGEL
jgi:ribonuclease T2